MWIELSFFYFQISLLSCSILYYSIFSQLLFISFSLVNPPTPHLSSLYPLLFPLFSLLILFPLFSSILFPPFYFFPSHIFSSDVFLSLSFSLLSFPLLSFSLLSFPFLFFPLLSFSLLSFSSLLSSPLLSVAGLVGEGLSRLFTCTGYEKPEVAEVSKTLANTMGLLLQKTNIIRDYLEDYVDGRAFWPQDVCKHLRLSETVFLGRKS